MAKISQAIKQTLPKDIISLTPSQIGRLKNIGEVILGLVGVAGIVSLAAIAPNALQLIDKAAWVRKTYKNRLSKRKEQNRKLSQTFYYLKSNGYIQMEPAKDGFIVKITAKGREKTLQLNFQSMGLPKTKQWDKKWWVILSDIPTDLRSQSDLFRKKIKSLGMMTLQRSVWIYPFDPRDEIAFVAKYYGLENYVTYIKAETLDQEDERAAKHFFELK